MELRRHIPYKYRKTPGFLDGKFDKKVLVEGVLLVAMRDLENEEVWFSSSRDRLLGVLLLSDESIMAWGVELNSFRTFI